MRKITDFDYHNKKVLLRVDLNVPVIDGKIIDDTRINKIIPTINYLLDHNAKIIITTHFGRPKFGYDPQYSVKFLIENLSKKINKPIKFANKIEEINPDDTITLLENLRFFPGETKNDSVLAAELASKADFFINDAFSCSHRKHTSIVKITEFLPSSAGLLLQAEIENLNSILSTPQKPIAAIIGGGKVSTKLELLNSLIHKMDYLVIGGAMANTFLKAQGQEVGKSLYEEELVGYASKILSTETSCKIILPQDVVVVKEIKESSINRVINLNHIAKDEMIVDIGPFSCLQIHEMLKICKTVILNGPVGVFEYFPFSVGTTNILREIAKLTSQNKLLSIAGGGDIVAAISKAGLFEQFSYISTAGGAFLEWLEGKELPGIASLK